MSTESVPIHFVPAQAGTKAHYIVVKGKYKLTDVRTVIAWRCRHDTFETVPVTVSNGKLDSRLPHAVEFADGSIEAVGSKLCWGSWPDYHQWLNP